MYVVGIYINQFASRGGRKLGGKERHPEEDDEGGDEKDADDDDDDADADDDDDDDTGIGDHVGMVKAFQNQNACIAAWRGPGTAAWLGMAAWLVVMRGVRAAVVLVLFRQEHPLAASMLYRKQDTYLRLHRLDHLVHEQCPFRVFDTRRHADK